jgi:hypothetical protein
MGVSTHMGEELVATNLGLGALLTVGMLILAAEKASFH